VAALFKRMTLVRQSGRDALALQALRYYVKRFKKAKEESREARLL